MDYTTLNSPELVKYWRTHVKDFVNMGRDSAMMKDALIKYTPVQIVLGMYRWGSKSASIPSFLRQYEEWLEEDEIWAEVELAIFITKRKPDDYYLYLDLVEVETATAFQQSLEARGRLRIWAEEVLTNGQYLSLTRNSIQQSEGSPSQPSQPLARRGRPPKRITS